MTDRDLEEALVGRLRLLSRDESDLPPDVRATQRARLVAMAAVRTPEAPPARWRRLLTARADDVPVARWRTRLTAGLAGAAMTVGALSGLVALAKDADPGDLLYGLKRGSEQTQLALAADADRGVTLLGFASNRLAELGELTGAEAGAASVGPVDGTGSAVAAAGVDADTVVEVLTTMDEQTTEGASWLTTTAVDDADADAFSTLAEWTMVQRAGLVALTVPAQAEQALADSVALVDQVAARAAAWQVALACPGSAPVAGVDSLGPVPGDCLPSAVGTDPQSAPPAGPEAPGAPTETDTDTDTDTDTTAVPTGGATTGAGPTTPPTTGSGAGPTTDAVPPVVPPVETTVPSTTVPPLIDVPLLPSATVCVGGLICLDE